MDDGVGSVPSWWPYLDDGTTPVKYLFLECSPDLREFVKSGKKRMNHNCGKLRADMLSVLTQRNYESPLLLAYTDFDGMLFQGGNALIEAPSQDTVLVRLRVWDWYLNGMPANALIDISTDEAFFKFFSGDACELL